MIRHLALLALTLLLAPNAAHAASEPDLSGLFGLNGVGFFHYRDQPDATKTATAKMDLTKQAGARWDRFDFWWGEIEPQKGVWKWDKADWLIDFYTKNRVSPLPILCYGANWMKQSPSTPEDYADFAEYVGRVVARYKGRVRCWEIWNEPNIPTFWKPQPDVAAYTALLKAAYTAAHRADPSCVVVAAAANETDINWLRDIAKLGGLSSMDAVSIHPYSMSDGPEEMDLARQIRNVKTFLREHGRPNMPVWITEMGWTSSIEKPQEMENASRYMAQSFVIAASEGVQRLFWFNLQDWNEGGKLEGWGLVSPEMKPKTTFTAYRALAHRLAPTRFAGWVSIPGGCGYLFQRGRDQTLVAWAHRGKSPRLALAPGAKVSDLFGKPIAASGEFTLGADPVFVAGGVRSLQKPLAILSSPPALESENVVVNGSLDEMETSGNPYGWRRGMFYGGADRGDFMVEKGAQGCAIGFAKSEDAFWQSYPVPAMPGERYTLTAEVRTEGATGENGAQILYLSGPGWGWRGGPVSATVTGTTDGWKTVRVQGTVPEDADVVRVNLVSKNNTGRVLFRNVRLVRER